MASFLFFLCFSFTSRGRGQVVVCGVGVESRPHRTVRGLGLPSGSAGFFAFGFRGLVQVRGRVPPSPYGEGSWASLRACGFSRWIVAVFRT